MIDANIHSRWITRLRTFLEQINPIRQLFLAYDKIEYSPMVRKNHTRSAKERRMRNLRHRDRMRNV